MDRDVYRFSPVVEHDGATWHVTGRSVWVDSFRAAQEIRDQLVAAGYFLYDSRKVEDLSYEFVFYRERPQDFRAPLRSGVVTLYYRLLAPNKLSEEVVYRYGEGSMWVVFTAETRGCNAKNIELCQLARDGAEVKARPHLLPTSCRP